MAGLNVNLTGYGDWSPAMTLARGAAEQGRGLNLHLGDADGTSHVYKFDLRKLKPGVPQQVVAEYGASLAEPQNIEKPGTTPGWARVTVIFMVIGDWSGKPIDVVLSGIDLAPPTDELRAGRAKLRELQAKEAERPAWRPRPRSRPGKAAGTRARRIRRTAPKCSTSAPWRRT